MGRVRTDGFSAHIVRIVASRIVSVSEWNPASETGISAILCVNPSLKVDDVSMIPRSRQAFRRTGLQTRPAFKATLIEHPKAHRFMPDPTRDLLETFENPYPQRNFIIDTVAPEFTSMCPKTGQPDFGTLTITYIADKVCFELKSLKMYLQQYRNHGAFYERVTNMILDDLVAVTSPRWMKIEAAFTPRGGIRTTVIVEHGKRPE